MSENLFAFITTIIYNITMLLTHSDLINMPVLSVQTGAQIGSITDIIIDPNNLSIIAFRLQGSFDPATPILDISSIREYSQMGFIIDNVDELVSKEDVVRISEVIDLNFKLIDLKVESKKGSKLGKISNFTATPEDLTIQQIIVRRPTIKAIMDPELTISRNEIVEVTDDKVVVKDEEKVLKQRAEKEDFIPNFVNPFRNSEFSPSPARTENPDDIDTE